MTAPATLDQPTGTEQSDLCHLCCYCDEDTALCGLDITDHLWVQAWENPDICVVCYDLARIPCGGCGFTIGDLI